MSHVVTDEPCGEVKVTRSLKILQRKNTSDTGGLK